MPVKIFCCYAHEDEALFEQLKRHLIPLQRQGLIDVWYDRDISAGTDWEQQIKERLNTSQIILLLLSPDFMASEYCYSIEMKRAIERHERGEASVIPIIIRSVHWEITRLSKLQALPTDAKPVKSWPDLDEAFFNVAEGIKKVVENLIKSHEVLEEPERIPQTLAKHQHFEESHPSFKTIEKPLTESHNPGKLNRLENEDQYYLTRPRYSLHGTIQRDLKRNKEALAGIEQAILYWLLGTSVRKT